MISGYPKAVVATGVGLILASAIGIALALWQMRSDAISDAVLSAENTAVLLSEQTSETVQSVELVLDGVISDVVHRTPSRLTQSLVCPDNGGVLPYAVDRLSNISAGGSITILDPSGDVVCTTIKDAPPTNLSERDYFQHARDSRDPALFVSQPVVSKISGALVLAFSKRIEDANGNFLGLASLAVKIDSLQAMYVAVKSVRGAVISLARRDGTIILRYPDAHVRAGQKLPAGLPWYDVVAKGGGSYLSPGVFDGLPKYVAVQPITRYPLVINVTSNEADILAPWRIRATVIAALSVAIQAALALLLNALFKQVRKLRASEASLKRSSREAAVANARFQATLANMSKGVVMCDAQGRIVIHNLAYQQIWGASSEDLKPGTKVSDLLEARMRSGVFSPRASQILAAKNEPNKLQTLSEVLELGDGRSIRVVNDPMEDGGWVSTHEDITESQQANARIAHMAHHDVLTGLLNRSGFMDNLQARLRVRNASDFAVLLVDLDRFKEVNDTFGHMVGDEVLCLVAARLEWAIETGDFAARLGGDEFAIYLSRDHELEPAATALAERVIEAMSAPFKIGANEISIGVCLGIAIASDDAADVQTILRSADLALYRAKSEGRNRFRFFAPSMEVEFQSRRALVQDMKAAIAADELRLVYQPIVDSQSLEIRAMEALARWTHPVRGMISPAVFIPLAEEAGLINELGAWALRRACRDARGWERDVKVCVNVSGIQISHPAFPDTVARILQETGLPAQRLEIEITESTLVSDAQHALSTLEAVKRLGVSVALDDFGTGYSSLSYLKMFPFDVIKIDKSFIDDMQTHRGCATIVAAIQSLASGFDMIVTAEGVETRDQFELLRVAGISQIQGYLFGKPAPAAHWDFSRPLIAA